jgi:hypothetical protein
VVRYGTAIDSAFVCVRNPGFDQGADDLGSSHTKAINLIEE